MGNLTSSLTVSLKDDVSDPAMKVGKALKNATSQVQAMGKAGIGDRLGQQISRLGLSAKDIDKVAASWKTYSSAAGLAAKSSDWTKSQASQVRSWENATVGALRNVMKAQRAYAATVKPDPKFNGGKAIAGAVGGGVAVASGYKAKEFGKKAVVSAAEFDIGIRKQREFVDIPKDTQDRVLIPQAKKIGQDTQFSNLDVVKAQTKAMQGLPSSYDATTRAEVGAAIVESVKHYALTMEADLEGSSEAIRTFLQTTNKDISSKEKAVAEATRATNLMVKMAKLGGMNDEDVQQFMKFGAGTATAAGLSDTTLAAIGATGRRGGLRGDELGVFMRAMSSKLVAPTSKGLDALTVAGIDYNKFTTMPGGLSTDNLEALSKRRFGKGVNEDQRSRLNDVLENSEVVSNREEFTKQVSDILAEGFDKKKDGKTKAQDAQKIAKMVGDFHKLSTESVDAEGLLNAIMTNPKMNIGLLNAFLTDKHGGKGSILGKKWDDFGAGKKELDHVADDPDFAKRKADEIMGGLGGSFERLKGSVENLTLSVGQANEAMLKSGMDKLGTAMDAVSNMPEKMVAWGSGIVASVGALGGSLLTRAALERFGIVGVGSGAAGVAGGLATGALVGAAMSDLSKDVLKANPEAMKSLLENSMLGAMSGDAAFAAGILQPGSTPGRYEQLGNRSRAGSTERRGAWIPGQGPDVFTTGVKGVEHLNQSSEASAAAATTIASYRSTAESSLAAVDPVFSAAVARWNSIMGGVNSSPSITPKFGPAPSIGKGASLGGRSSFQGAHSDGNAANFGTT